LIAFNNIGPLTCFPALGIRFPTGIISCIPVWTKGITTGRLSASITNLSKQEEIKLSKNSKSIIIAKTYMHKKDAGFVTKTEANQ